MSSKFSSLAKRKFIIRRKLLIMPRFQLLLIGVNLSVLTLMMGVIWLTVRGSFGDLEPVSGLTGIEAEFYQRYLAYQVRSFETALLGSFGAGLATVALVTLIVSHRLAGPLIRLRIFFTALRNGADPVPPLQFRDGDYCGDLPLLINESIARLKGDKPKDAK
ncbi:MAG: hypothetical protein NDJ90_04675 [Oligoflexia bacterium]|nr:hypothetical protein [Oligoflexia bacterium]